MPLASPVAVEPRPSEPPRARGMTFGHELLLALIMAVAMGATVVLYR